LDPIRAPNPEQPSCLGDSISRYNSNMSRTAAEILEEALQLPPDEVDWLVESLLIKENLEPEAEVETAWDGEIKRRLDEIDSGSVKMVPLEDVLARMDARIKARQSE
jgi:putative addiction module component (TIGR02574 family)